MLRLACLSLLLIAAPACSEVQVPGVQGAAVHSTTTGLDAALTAQALAEAEALPRLHSLIVVRDGQVQTERVFRGPGLDTPVNVKSVSKTLLSAVAGAAIADGVLTGVDQPISDHLADRFPRDPDPRLARITVGHLLSMRAGLGSTSGQNYGAWVGSRDWVRHALARPFEAEPGGTLIYSTGTSHLLSAVIAHASGRSTRDYAIQVLGEPLGIAIPQWPRDPQGIHFGGNDMLISPRDLVVFGEMYRNGGLHAGRRVLPEAWVQASWNGQGTSRFTGDGQGYGWWIRQVGGRPVYYGWGYGGQMLFVVPTLDLTVVMTSDPSPVAERTDHVQRLHALLADRLIPAAERGG